MKELVIKRHCLLFLRKILYIIMALITHSWPSSKVIVYIPFCAPDLDFAFFKTKIQKIGKMRSQKKKKDRKDKKIQKHKNNKKKNQNYLKYGWTNQKKSYSVIFKRAAVLQYLEFRGLQYWKGPRVICNVKNYKDHFAIFVSALPIIILHIKN